MNLAYDEQIALPINHCKINSFLKYLWQMECEIVTYQCSHKGQSSVKVQQGLTKALHW